MEKMYPRVKNYHVTVKEMNNTIVFLRKLERGDFARGRKIGGDISR